MRGLVVVGVVLLLSTFSKCDEDDDFVWQNFKKIHKISYKNQTEDVVRKSIFRKELKHVLWHNRLHAQGKFTFRASVNRFSSTTLEEFIKGYNGFRSDLAEPNSVTKTRGGARFRTLNVLPPQVDWRQRGVNTSVKDQEFCQSCWALAATAAIEAHELIYFNRPLQLSEQNIIDCAESNYNRGCLGGHMLRAFNYTRKVQGISHSAYYPYEVNQGECRYRDDINAGCYAAKYQRLPKGDEEELKRVVAFVGPVAAAINGDLYSLKIYNGGVYYDKKCDSSGLSHAVLIVGYGTDPAGGDYWLIKNSIGPFWGENGYLKLARNRDNHCGIASDASYPIMNSQPLRGYIVTSPPLHLFKQFRLQ